MSANKLGRNDPCSCGSGKKYKHCCGQSHNGQSRLAEDRQMVNRALQVASAYFQQGNLAQAEAVCQQILQVSPKQVDALHMFGAMALRRGDVDSAIDWIKKAIAVQNKNPEFYGNLGLALHEKGQLADAEKHYRKALQLDAQYLNASFNLHALLLDHSDLKAAVDSLRKVLSNQPSDLDAKWMLGILLDYQGKSEVAQAQFASLANRGKLIEARLDAWNYLKHDAVSLPKITGSRYRTFEQAVKVAPQEGLVLEFGVLFGTSIRQIAGMISEPIHGFDSFEGLPERWHQEDKGSYSTKGVIPEVPAHVTLHQGWFENTLPAFLQQHTGNVRLVNVDCDLYSSTKTVLDLLAPRIVKGSVLVFDEYIGNAHWREDEHKAFQEAVEQYQWKYQYICFSPFTKQVAVQII